MHDGLENGFDLFPPTESDTHQYLNLAITQRDLQSMRGRRTCNLSN